MTKKVKLGMLATSLIVGRVVYKKIKITKEKAKQEGYTTLGVDWNTLLNHSADPIDFTKQLRRELKWAWQRLTKGYDNRMFWSFDSHMDELIIKDLQWMIEKRMGSPVLEGWDEDNCHENWTIVLKEMLHYFMQSTERYCSEINEYEDLVDYESYFVPTDCGDFTMHYKDVSEEAKLLRDKYLNRSDEIDQYRADNHKKGLEMLTKYYNYLWD